jgi:alkanesulfonate monooxygenase SsuD/methylene tetrahydromethanopterin reductase-like flavin-dependent oxidoreductase (luciferase family)
MDIFTFDFVPYGKNLKGQLGYPVGRHLFDPEIAAQTFHNHVEQFQLCEEVGFDGISLNEHHGSPYGLDNSPNVFLSYIARATSTIKLTMLGNLLPLHAHPLRLAEELAMLDIITRGRLIAGFVRGIPREHLVYSVPLSESKARFDEALDVIFGAWTSDVFSHHGRFFNYDDVDMWPRPYQQPHPPVWMGAMSDESTRWCGRRPEVTLCVNFLPTDQVAAQLRVFREAAGEAGRQISDKDVVYGRHVFVAETEAEAERIARPHVEYYWQNLIHEINMAALHKLMAQNPDVDWNKVKPPFDYGAATLENLRERGLLILGTPDQVFEQIMEQYEQIGGFGVLLAMIRMGSMPQDVLLRCLRLMGEELIPRLHAVKSKVHGAKAPAAA